MYNLNFNGRAATGDDAYDIKDVPYGNAFTLVQLTMKCTEHMCPELLWLPEIMEREWME